jgi:hypothetical protein
MFNVQGIKVRSARVHMKNETTNLHESTRIDPRRRVQCSRDKCSRFRKAEPQINMNQHESAVTFKDRRRGRAASSLDGHHAMNGVAMLKHRSNSVDYVNYGKSKLSSIRTSVLIFANRAYLSSTINVGSRLPNSYPEIALRDILSDSSNLASISF